MKQFLARHNISKGQAWLIGIGLMVLLIIVSIASRAITSRSYGIGLSGQATSGFAPEMAFDDGLAVSRSAGFAAPAALSVEGADVSLPGIPLPPDMPETTPGNDAEDFEVTEYSMDFEVTDSDDLCGQILELKALEEVIFERSNDHENGCNFTFKVANPQAGLVLDVLQKLGPENFSENTFTIKRTLSNLDSEVAILEGKLQGIEETLAEATAAYEDITDLAQATRDAGALASIIDSKIGVIERLTEKRLQTTERLERILRNQAEQRDRLIYTTFYVTVYENPYFSGDQIRDSWKQAVRDFLRDVNGFLQGISIGLLGGALRVLQWALYIILLLILARFGFEFVKRLWRKKSE